MKAFIFIAALLISLSGFSQDVELPRLENTGEVGFSEVVEVGEFPAKLIYFSALKFYKSKFLSEDLVLQDEDRYMIMGPGYTSFTYVGKSMPVLFNCDFQFKDGRYKYELTGFVVDTNGGGKINLNEPWPKHMAGKGKIYSKTIEEMNAFIDEFKAYILKDLNSEDW